MSNETMHTPDSEKAVLGVIAAFPGRFERVRGLLSVKDFYDPRHGAIYEAALALADDEQEIDPMILINALDRRGKLEKAGGAAYITALEQSVINPNNIEYHAKIVKEDSIRRDLRAKLQEIAERTADASLKPKDHMAQLSELLDDLAKKTVSGRTASAEELAQETWDSIMDGMDNKGAGLLSGIPRLDRLTYGWQAGDLIILAARPSVGKTAMALQLALQALKAGTGVVFFSLEMSRVQLVERLIAQETRIPLSRIRGKNLDESNLAEVERFLEILKNWSLFVEDCSDVDSNSILSKANLLKARHPEIGLIVVDYLQLMDYGRGGGREENRNLELGRISRGLKKIARSLDLPVIALSQLSRGMEKTGRAPVLADLRDSGAIEQDADLVAFLHRRNPPDQMNRVDNVDLIVAKHRNGPLGKIPLAFLQERTFFVQAETETQAPPEACSTHWSD